jgi:hypothetical protein
MSSKPTIVPSSAEPKNAEPRKTENERKGETSSSKPMIVREMPKVADRQQSAKGAAVPSTLAANLSLRGAPSLSDAPQASVLKKKTTPPFDQHNFQAVALLKRHASSGMLVPPQSPTAPNRPSNAPVPSSGGVQLNPTPRSARSQLAKTPSEKTLTLPPSEHFKMCLYKLETEDYNGAFLDITQCTALLANRHTQTGGEIDPRRIRLCVAYKLALNILIDIKKRQSGDQSGPLAHRHLIQYLQENNLYHTFVGANIESTKSSSAASSGKNANKTPSASHTNTPLSSSPTSESNTSSSSALSPLSSPSSSTQSAASSTNSAPLTPQIIAHIAMLTKFLADIPLLPRHRLICYRMAIKWNMEAKNYGVAAALIRTLLKKKILDKAELEKKLKVCEQHQFKDDNPIPPTTKLCYKSLKLTPLGTYNQCKYCEAVYADDVLQPSVCTYCMVGKLSRPVLPIFSKKQ